jgi:hypothetical protein
VAAGDPLMTAYRLPRRYRRYRTRRRDAWVPAAIGLAAAAAFAAAHPGHASGILRHAAEGLPGAAPVTSGSEVSFIRAVLADLRAPDTAADEHSLAAWYPHEFPSWPPPAENNPWASTLWEPGSTIYNGSKVRNYPTAAEGAEATARTLADGWYPLILAALRSGAGLCGQPGLAAEFLTWSGNGYPEVC